MPLKSVLMVMFSRLTKPSGFVLAILAIALIALAINAHRRIGKLALGYVVNDYEQITYSVWSKRTECPHDTGSVLVLVPMGQSNAANSISGLYNDLKDERILNFLLRIMFHCQRSADRQWRNSWEHLVFASSGYIARIPLAEHRDCANGRGV